MQTIHNQSIEDCGFLGGYNILLVEVSLLEEEVTERISAGVIKDFLAIIVGPQVYFRSIPILDTLFTRVLAYHRLSSMTIRPQGVHIWDRASLTSIL